jgi:hypothetical protein
VGALRSADPEPGDLSAARGVPWPAALALGTAGLRGLLSLGVGGVPPPPPFFSLSGLLLLFASAELDLLSNQEMEPPSDGEGSTATARGDPPRARRRSDQEPAQKGVMNAYLVLEPCIAAPAFLQLLPGLLLCLCCVGVAP